MASKKKKNGECAYCGSIGVVTNDHIPPKGFFAEPRPTDLIKVPACYDCNHSASLDDEYVRTVFALDHSTFPHPIIQKHILPKTKRLLGNSKKTDYASNLMGEMRPIYVKMSNGLFLPTALFYADKVRINKFTERIIKGLFYHEFSKRVSDNCTISVIYEKELQSENIYIFHYAMRELLPAIQAQPIKSIGDDVFSYQFLRANDDEYTTGWIISFYQHIDCLVLIVNNKKQ